MGRNGRRMASDFDWAQVQARTVEATNSLN
jgi:hypothetical protein